MRLKGRQGRFVAIVLSGWTAWRIWMLLPVTAGLAGGPIADAPRRLDMPTLRVTAPRPFEAAMAIGGERGASARRPVPTPTRTSSIEAASVDTAPARGVRGEFKDVSAPVQRTAFVPVALLPPPLQSASPRAIEASTYLFLRPGGASGLTPGGTLGASQAAARIAVALNRDGPVRAAVAARLYAPLHTRGAEAAVGLDWHPLPAVPLRLSVERRIGLDRAGRDAWSAYAAGGFYREAGPIVIDGYGQAGMVGARRRDLFVDGAVRAGRRLGPLTLGTGVWGAAQPGAQRLDAGPRAALRLPVDRHSLTLVLEGRLRLAGRAAPGSGAVLTLAADF